MRNISTLEKTMGILGWNFPKKKLYFVYALLDPRNCQIRYVGYTSNIKKRYETYEYQGKDKNTYVYNWCKSLKNVGFKPRMEILCVSINKNEALIQEKYYIAKFKNDGIKLTNLSDGGEFPTFSNESRKKMSISLKKRWSNGDFNFRFKAFYSFDLTTRECKYHNTVNEFNRKERINLRQAILKQHTWNNKILANNFLDLTIKIGNIKLVKKQLKFVNNITREILFFESGIQAAKYFKLKDFPYPVLKKLKYKQYTIEVLNG